VREVGVVGVGLRVFAGRGACGGGEGRGWGFGGVGGVVLGVGGKVWWVGGGGVKLFFG